MNIVSASIQTVQLGKKISTEGLMSEYGDYGIAVPQFCQLISFQNKHASATFKALLLKGKDAPSMVVLPKWKTPLNSQPVNVLTLKQVEKLLLRLSVKGHEPAIDLSEALLGLSLHQMFSDAFNKEVTPQDRQDFLTVNWTPSRKFTISMQPWFQQNCIANHYPAWDVHDYMTCLVFGETAEQARQKPLVMEELDPTIGLNHQEDADGLEILARVKRKFCLLKTGTWQEKVERAVRETIK